MAAIRWVDSWLRCPGARVSHYRSVMVVAERWAEQRVLMRGYAESRDQMLPTIVLHGAELAIGPAGVDINGPWGIHVADHDTANAVKQGLEDAARSFAGSKGDPPRLLDENQSFDGPAPPFGGAGGAARGRAVEREPTGTGAPDLPRGGQPRSDLRRTAVAVIAPVAAARVLQGQLATVVPSTQGHLLSRTTRPGDGARTALGYTSGAGAQSAIVRLGLAPHVSAKLGPFTDRVVSAEFSLDARERRALNTLGEQEHVTARALGHVLDLHDAVSFMEELVKKLEAHGLGDLVEPAEPVGGEPTYRLRR
jgi:hypothetical protein